MKINIKKYQPAVKHLLWSRLLAGLSMIALLTACNDFLDVLPDNRAEIDSNDKITAMLVSAYPSNSAYLVTELSSDNVMDNGKQYDVSEPIQESTYLWQDAETTENDSPQSIWDGHYNAVASANQALQAIENMGNPASLNPQKGEALICRAYAHFVLANVFCLPYNPQTAGTDLGLPYSTEPETKTVVRYSRGTLAELYQKINEDIEAGLPLINDAIYKVPKYHFNKKAAYAFAARFNLFYHKYNKVIEYANVVLGSNPASVLRNWNAIASAASDWAVRTNMYINASESANLLLLTAYSSWPYIHGPYSSGLQYAHSRTICERQTIRANGIWSSSSSLCAASSIWLPEQKMPVSKFAGYFEYTDKVAGIGFVHLVATAFTTDETLLCRAEAYLLQPSPNYEDAVADINLWMTSHCSGITKPYKKEDLVNFYKGVAYMPLIPVSNLPTSTEHTIKKYINPQGFTVTAGDQENMIQCILHLRRLETVHEGLRWLDIKRYGIEISHNRAGLSADVLLTDDPRRAIQLPQDVITAGLAPNPRRIIN